MGEDCPSEPAVREDEQRRSTVGRFYLLQFGFGRGLKTVPLHKG